MEQTQGTQANTKLHKVTYVYINIYTRNKHKATHIHT